MKNTKNVSRISQSVSGSTEAWPNEPLHVTAARWRLGMKPNGFGWVARGALERDGAESDAELHWYEAHGMGKKEMKVKELLD
ncbi:MAG: hypothetical protein HYZ50_09180 [Deltaproteobacteria bacterium]|nr:hypothetical protein [Deltaproteobacteria bacterium]